MNSVALREFELEGAEAISIEHEQDAPVWDTETETLPLDPHYADVNEAARTRRKWLAAVYLLTAVVYLSWRPTVFNPHAPLLSALFYAAEIATFAIGALYTVTCWYRPVCKISRAPEGLAVDVLVTVYNEPLNVIRRTMLGAVAISYPHETWLLDDGNRDEVRALAEELGCRYLARTENKGAKAGNLNNGLKHATGEFIALLDADHVPQQDFLHRLLGYFRDPSLAFVQTPQDYFNLDSFQHDPDKAGRRIWHEQSFFHYVCQTGRNRWNAATLCGSSAVMRRVAVDAIGGFPETTITEDMHAAVRLHKRGYRSVFHPEPLAFGIAPPDMAGFLRQRLRWGQGNLQVCREEGIPFTPKLSLAQNLCYFALTSSYLEAWQKTVFYAVPAFVLVTQIPPVASSSWIYAALFLPYFLASITLSVAQGRGFERIVANETFAMARLGVGLIAISGLFRKRIPFRVSSKDLGQHTSPLLLVPQFLVLGTSAGALLYAGVRFALGMKLSMPVGILTAVSLLAAYNAIIATRVIRKALFGKHSDAQEYDHAVALPLGILDPNGSWKWTQTRTVSLDRIRLVDEGPCTKRDIEARLLLPDGPIDLVLRRQDDTTFAIAWANQSDSDRLSLALHAGRWHRPLRGMREFVATPVDKLLRRATIPLNQQPWLSFRRRDLSTPLGFRSPDGTHTIAFGRPCAEGRRGKGGAVRALCMAIPDGIALESTGAFLCETSVLSDKSFAAQMQRLQAAFENA